MMRCKTTNWHRNFQSGNFCFEHGPEKPSGGSEKAEKPKESGIPIDAKGPDNHKESLETFEKIIQDRYGGQFYKLSDIGVENADSEAHISTPDLSDPKFKGKDPRVIVWFHQNGGQDYSNEQAKKVYEQVKKMRENGDPVVLVMPQDHKKKGAKNWSDFTNDKSFKALIGQAEKVTGQKLSGNITFASSSGGYKGIGNVLRSLREAGDPRARELYQGIRQIGLCDSLYGEEDEIAQWAVSDPEKRLFSYNGTQQVQKHNKILRGKIQGLLDKMDRKMGDNIQVLADDLHHAGHNVDPEMLAKYLEAPPSSPDYGLNFPPRAPDAMTGEQFNEALKQCKTLEDKQRLIITQASKGAFSPNFMKPKVYETTVAGKKVEVPLYGMLRFGTADNETLVAADGETSQAVADMLQGHLPTADFYRYLYEDKRVKKAPFWYGQKLEGLVNSRLDSPMPYHTTYQGRTIPSGAAMRSAEYAQAHSDMYLRWCEQNGIKPDEFTLGHRKTVFMPHQANPDKIKFGGGLHALPVMEGGKIVNWKVQEGQFVQGVGDNAHEPSYYDYAQGTDIIGDPIIDGKRVPFRDVLSKPEYEDVRVALFSKKALGPECRYNMPGWMKEQVQEHLKKYPAGSKHPHIAPSTIGEPTESPEEQPIAQAETPPVSGGGVPVDTAPAYTGGGGHGGGGGYVGGGYGGGAPEVTPASYSPPTEKPQEHIEVKPTGKVFILGDSLSDGFVKGIKGMDLTHAHPAGREKSMGQTAREMVTTLKQKILTQENLAGSTLVIVGGSNDIFLPNSLEQIKKDLREIYTLAKAKGMKVVGATLPPLAHSSYSKTWASKTNTPYEQYNAALVERWQKLNEWIMGQEGAKDSAGAAIGPDKIIQLHKKFEDPSTPGKLRPDLYGKNGDGVHLANYSEMSQLLKGGIEALQPQPTGGSETFKNSPEFNEQTASYEYPAGDSYPLHVHVNKPANFDASKKTRVIMYGLPLGNSIEQTIGRIKEEGQDWHYNIQDIGAQVRLLREKHPEENIVVAYLQGPEKSLNQWRKKHANSPELFASLIDDVKGRVGAPNAEISIAGHSAGGGFQREIIEHYATIPDNMKRLNFLDSFHFLNVQQHGPKILTWLKAGNDHRLSVISYEDDKAKMEFQGKGSSIARAQELVQFFRTNGVELSQEEVGGDNGYTLYKGMSGQVNIIVMHNPTGAILHTETVHRNGLIVAETGTTSDFNKISFAQYIQKGHTDTTPQKPEAAPQVVASADKGNAKPLTSGQSGKNAQWRKEAFPKGAKTADSNVVGAKAQELLGQLKMGESTTFKGEDGKTYVALKEYHAGDPRHPNPHPGVSVAEVPDEGVA